MGSRRSEGGRANTAYQTAMNQQDDWTRFMRLQSAAFAELKPIKGLSLRTQFSVRLMGMWSQALSEKTIATNKEGQSQNYLEENAGGGWIISGPIRRLIRRNSMKIMT